MRRSVWMLLMCFSVDAWAQINFSGTYTGKINGDFTQIEMQQSASTVTGKYIETGNTYELRGKIVSNQLIGELFISGATLALASFEASKTDRGIYMDLLLLGVTRVSADFIKSNTTTTTPSTKENVNYPAGQSPPTDHFERDPAVVGHWIKEEVINSGVGDQAASFVTAYFLQFKQDGTFIQEKSSGSGGSNWSSVDQKKPDVNGHWYTKDQIMYIRPAGEKDYVRLNRYLFHEGALVFKTEAGKYLIWSRR